MKVRLLVMGMVMTLHAVAGCSVFRGTQRLDITPFANNTSMMFAEAAKVNRRFRMRQLKPYTRIPEIAAFNEHGMVLIDALKGIVRYSNQLVALDGSPKTETEKTRLLAEYLDQAMNKAVTRQKLDEIGFTVGMRDSTLAEIRAAKTFLDGVDAASPLINAVVTAILDGLDAQSAEVPILVQAIENQILDEFREKREAYEGLTRLQARYLIAATWLYEGRSGRAGAVDSLLAADPSMAEFIPSPGAVASQELDAAEAALIERLGRIAGLIEQLADARASYEAKMQELEDLRANLDLRIKVARDAVVIWGQSHRNLGAGVSVPPLIHLSSIASGVASALPVP